MLCYSSGVICNRDDVKEISLRSSSLSENSMHCLTIDYARSKGDKDPVNVI